jgi:predicted transcriptional regulator
MIAIPAPEGELLPAPRPLLLSLRPRFAQAILDGTKTVELRRTRVSAPPGTLLVLYASSPVMAVVGVAPLADRDAASLATIWRRYRDKLGL